MAKKALKVYLIQLIIIQIEKKNKIHHHCPRPMPNPKNKYCKLISICQNMSKYIPPNLIFDKIFH